VHPEGNELDFPPSLRRRRVSGAERERARRYVTAKKSGSDPDFEYISDPDPDF
jgi:hypothetical protein